MPASRFSPILQVLRRMVEDERVRELSDQALLKHFATDHDEAAFLALLRRRGPMVLSVCRALLPCEADAEDAFQATFLVLVRRARSIRKKESLGSWLHGVAYRTARKAQAESAKRRQRETRLPKPESSPPCDVTWREVQEVLHEELNGISDRYREPLVLCYLQGLTLNAAAEQLGFAKSTLKTRLERGRALLRARLLRRGFGPPALLAVATWPAVAPACVPAGLFQVTAKAALSAAAGKALAGLVSANVLGLTKGGINAMTITKGKALVAGLLLLTGFGLALGGSRYPIAAQESDRELAERPLLARQDAKKADPGAAEEPKVRAVFRGHTNTVWSVRLTPDGNTVVSASFDKTVKVWDVPSGKEHLTLRGHRTLVDYALITPDGKTVVSADQNGGIKLWDLPGGRERNALTKEWQRLDALALSTNGRIVTALCNGVVKQWDTATGQEVGFLPGRGDVAAAFSVDGKLMAGSGVGPRSFFGVRLLELPSGRERMAWNEKDFRGEPLAFSADSKTLFTFDHKAETILLWELATGKLRFTINNVHEKHLQEIAIHPSGRVLAIAHRRQSDAVKLWNLVTGMPMADLNVENEGVGTVAFSADGSTLAAASNPDTAVHVWDVRGFWKVGPALKDDLSERGLESIWADLAGDDAVKAYHAIWTFARAPKQAVPWLAKRLPPVPTADAQATASLLAALDDGRFPVRNKATLDLEKLGESALPALHKALAVGPSAEARRRMEGLLGKLAKAETLPEQLRIYRAIEAQERAGTTEARQLLQNLADGVPAAMRTREAQASLQRMAPVVGR